MVEDRVLELHRGSADDFAVLCPTSGLAASGDADPGVSWHCPACGEMLARVVYPRQFLDVLFRCFSCGELSASPRRQPGQPLVGRPVLVPPGKYRLDSTLDVTGKSAMLVGRQALEGYLVETAGSAVPTPEMTPSQREIDGALLRELAAKAASLLGERYERLRASDQRGRSFPTPPPRRHRLIELICYAEEAARALDERQLDEFVELDANKIGELIGTIDLFERWRNHPAWPLLVAGLASDTEGQHSLILLAVASYMRDSGNGVGLVFEEKPGRIPDLWLEPSLAERLNIEIKTPMPLRGPRSSPLTADEAEELITRHVKKAASTQLAPNSSGLLAFGVFHLDIKEIKELISAAERVLERQRDHKKHLVGISVSWFGYTIETVTNAHGGGRTQLAASLETRVVHHPGYQGSLTFEKGLPPWRTGL